MAYFRRNDVSGEQEQDYVPVFSRENKKGTYDDGFDELNGDTADDEDLLSEEEEEELRRDRYRLVTGLGNLGAIVVGCVVILIMVALLLSLVNWLQSDVRHTFTLLNSRM